MWTNVESEDPQIHRPHLSSVDLVHIIHCNFGFSKANWQWCKQAGIPYVLTPLYYNADKFGMTFDEQRQMLEEAAAVTPFTQQEADLVTKCTGYPGPYKFVPNGTDVRFHSLEDPMQRTGVLAVAAREGTKGTGIVKELCEELGYPFTLGQGIPNAEMPALYKRHRVFVHAADLEVMSLVIGEALCANCRVLATNTNPGNEWYPGLRTFTPHMPANREFLRQELQIAYERQLDWDYRPNKYARDLTWDSVATQFKEIYSEILNNHSVTG